MIPLIINIARLATSVVMAESRAAAVALVRARVVPTVRSYMAGEVIKSLGTQGKWDGALKAAIDRDTGERFILLDAALSTVTEEMSQRDQDVLSLCYEIATEREMPVRAALSCENLGPGESSRLLRAVHGSTENRDISDTKMTISSAHAT